MKIIETVKWDPRLIVDTGQLKQALFFWFNQPIKVKEGTCGTSSSDWVYGEIPIKQTGKIFRFAVYLLTGKAIVLFIQSGDVSLTKRQENILIDGLRIKLQNDGERIPIEYERLWSRKTDLGFGVGLTIVAWFKEDPQNHKESVTSLVREYQNLWEEKKGR